MRFVPNTLRGKGRARYLEIHDVRSFRNDARRGQSGTLSSCSKRSRRTIFNRSIAMMSVSLDSMASSKVCFLTSMSSMSRPNVSGLRL